MIVKKTIWIPAIIFLFIFVNNTSLLTRPSGKPILLAHRGLAQTFPLEGVTAETNTAARIYTPEHPFLENTIPSMEAAFQAGADLVELDIHPTTDGKFAVFHDWTLDHRTNGTGVTRAHSLAELKALDIGYGYTADKGKSFPFRGKGVGLMPLLEEVLAHFPDRDLLIHIKSNDPNEGELLAQYLTNFPEERIKTLTFYGGNEPIEVLQKKLPNLRVMSKSTMKKALLTYMAIGWTGYTPRAMKNSHFHLPLKYARFLWGWPHRFIKRIESANSRFFLVHGDGTYSEGFDTLEDLKLLPASYSGGIWTDRIDKIAPVYSIPD